MTFRRNIGNAIKSRAEAVPRAAPAVVLVLPTYLPESFGGGEQQARKLALALANLGIRVSLVAPRLLSSTPGQEQDSCIAIRRFKVRAAPNLGGRHIGSLITWSAKLFWWLLSHRNDYDVIHIVHGRLHALPAVLAGYFLDKPTMIKIGRGGEEHFDLDVVKRKKVLGKCYARTIANIANAYIANSSTIASDLERWDIPNSRVHRVPNGVDIPPLSHPDRARHEVRCVFVGRLEAEKSLDLMIRGFAKLAGTPPATLTIVGDGKCRAQLEALVHELGVADRIFFVGPVEDVRPFLRDADIFVSTSSSEGMSNALLEAMSFGVMPLVSLVSGVTDVVEDGCTGLLFPAGDLQAFATRLNEAVELSDADRRKIGLRGRETVEKRFGIDEIAKRHIDIYRMLVGPGSAGTAARDVRSI